MSYLVPEGKLVKFQKRNAKKKRKEKRKALAQRDSNKIKLPFALMLAQKARKK